MTQPVGSLMRATLAFLLLRVGTSSGAPGSGAPVGAVLDVTAFGADRSGAEASDAAINAAIAVTNARGGDSTILFPPGVYRVDSPLLPIMGRNIAVRGHGALVEWRNTTAQSCLLTFHAVAEQRTALVSDVEAGSDTIEFTSNVEDGQLVRLNSSEMYYNSTQDSTRRNKKGELLVGVFETQCPSETVTDCGQTRAPSRVLYPEGKSPIFGYNKALTSATIITPSTNIAVHGLAIRGAGAHWLTVALVVEGARGVVIDGCSFEQSMAGIGVSSSHLVQVINSRFNRIDHIGLGYSLMVGEFVLGLTMANCIGDRGRHFMTTTGEAGIARDISVTGNTFRGSILGAIAPHAQGYDVTIQGNHISDCNVGIISRSPNTIIKGNTLVNCGIPNVSSVQKTIADQHAIYACEQGHINLVVDSNHILYDAARWHGLIHNQTMYGNAILVNGNPSETGHAEFSNEFVIIKSNTIQPLPHGVAIGVSSSDGTWEGRTFGTTVPPTHYPRRVHVQDNTIVGPGEYTPISVGGGSDVGANRIDAFLSGNTIDSAGTSATLPQIHASQLKTLTMEHNTLPAALDPATPAIRIDTVGDVHISSTTLSPGPESTSSSGRGCMIPQLNNVTSSRVESFGAECTDVVLPLPRCGGAGCTPAALEVSAWTSSGAFTKAVVVSVGAQGWQVMPMLNAVAGDKLSLVVVPGDASDPKNATLSLRSREAISFRATAL